MGVPKPKSKTSASGKAYLFIATHVDPTSGREQDIGEIACDASTKLSVVKADGSYTKLLNELVEKINSKDTLSVRPGGNERSPMESDTRQFTRGADNFLEGIKKYANYYYSVRLMTQDEIDDARDALDLK